LLSEVKQYYGKDKSYIPTIHLEDGLYPTMSDFHVPYHLEQTIRGIAKAYSKKSKGLILLGDIFDVESLSGFKKVGIIPRLLDEYEQGRRLIWDLAEMFEEIWMIMGNHEYRVLARTRNVDEIAFLDSFDLLRHIANGDRLYYDEYNEEAYLLKDSEAPKNIHYYGTSVMIANDILFAHPMHFSRVYGKTVSNVITDYKLELDYNFRACIIGHTHFCVNGLSVGTVMGYEIGCLAKPMKYLRKEIRKRKTHVGFMETYITNGRFDPYRSRVINLSQLID